MLCCTASCNNITVPYVQGVTERILRSLRKYGIQAHARPHCTLRRLLVHPKDKVEDAKKCGVVYHVSCLNCKQVYIGETGRRLEVRIDEHHKECKKVNSTIKTRNKSVTEDPDDLKSAIAKHTRQFNHVMDWDSVKILERV